MSEHLKLLDDLIQRTRNLLAAVEKGDLEGVIEESALRQALLLELKARGTPPDELPQISAHLNELKRLNDLAQAAVESVREALSTRLNAISRGKKTLTGYQKAVGAQRGHGTRFECA